MYNSKVIILVRHGESKGNVKLMNKDVYVNDSDITLTDRGKTQAKQLSVKLADFISNRNYLANKEAIDLSRYRPDDGVRYTNYELWVSPFERTRTTANIINEKLNIKDVYEDPFLVEQDFGDFDFQFYNNYENISPHSWFINQQRYKSRSARFWARVENGESFSDVYERVALFDLLRCRNNKNNQILVTHGNFILTALMYFTLSSPEYIFDMGEKIPNASAYVLERVDENKYKYVEKIT